MFWFLDHPEDGPKASCCIVPYLFDRAGFTLIFTLTMATSVKIFEPVTCKVPFFPYTSKFRLFICLVFALRFAQRGSLKDTKLRCHPPLAAAWT